MAQEIRKIVFSDQDVMDIIRHYCAKSGITLPRARLTGFAVADDGKGSYSLKLKFDDKAITNPVVLNSGEIGAAMIMYCRTQRIPLPRSAVKSLAKHGEQLALQVAVDWSKMGDGKTGPALQKAAQ